MSIHVPWHSRKRARTKRLAVSLHLEHRSVFSKRKRKKGGPNLPAVCVCFSFCLPSGWGRSSRTCRARCGLGAETRTGGALRGRLPARSSAARRPAWRPTPPAKFPPPPWGRRPTRPNPTRTRAPKKNRARQRDNHKHRHDFKDLQKKKTAPKKRKEKRIMPKAFIDRLAFERPGLPVPPLGGGCLVLWSVTP